MKKFAVICQWKDNPNDFQVLEYFSTYVEGRDYIKTLPKNPDRYSYHVMSYQ